MFTYIDLFAGAGGLSEGFQRENYLPLFHIEMDHAACNTLYTRQTYYTLLKENKLSIYHNYLSKKISQEQYYSYLPQNDKESICNEKLTNENINDIKKKIEQRLKPYANLDLLIGGPPCQTYSLVGRAIQKDKMHTDERTHLFKLYINILKEFEPKVFVFENVTGLLSAKNEKGVLYLDIIKKSFSKIGYDLDYKVLNARDFGVLQNRKRVILIGWKKGTNFRYPDFPTIPSEDFIVSDLFLDLPHINNNNYLLDNIPQYLQNYKIREKQDYLTQHSTRYVNSRDKQIYKLAITAWEKKKKRISYDMLPEDLTTHKNKTAFLDRFKVVAPDLTYSQTVLAHLSKDGHYYIYPDKKQCRSITVREAARLQSFPDNYFFEGSIFQAFKQIGNAVPPLMSQSIAKKIKEQLYETL